MNVLAAVVDAWSRDGTANDDTESESSTAVTPKARCRNCGRYYDVDPDRCPHCGSGNKIRGGAPAGQTRR